MKNNNVWNSNCSQSQFLFRMAWKRGCFVTAALNIPWRRLQKTGKEWNVVFILRYMLIHVKNTQVLLETNEQVGFQKNTVICSYPITMLLDNIIIRRASRFPSIMTKFKYLGTKGTNKNFIHEEIKYILNCIQLATITFMNFCIQDNTFINILQTFCN